MTSLYHASMCVYCMYIRTLRRCETELLVALRLALPFSTVCHPSFSQSIPLLFFSRRIRLCTAQYSTIQSVLCCGPRITFRHGSSASSSSSSSPRYGGPQRGGGGGGTRGEEGFLQRWRMRQAVTRLVKSKSSQLSSEGGVGKHPPSNQLLRYDPSIPYCTNNMGKID